MYCITGLQYLVLHYFNTLDYTSLIIGIECTVILSSIIIFWNNVIIIRVNENGQRNEGEAVVVMALVACIVRFYNLPSKSSEEWKFLFLLDFATFIRLGGGTAFVKRVCHVKFQGFGAGRLLWSFWFRVF